MPRRAKRDCEHNPFEKGDHSADIQAAVTHYITEFFQEKQWFCGGDIPRRDLLSDSSLKTVLRTQFDKNWEEFVHQKCLVTIPLDPAYKLESHLPWSVRCLIDLLYSMEVAKIPKEFKPGIVLLYFKFCKGVKIPPPPIL
jgi:hypothetical protein